MIHPIILRQCPLTGFWNAYVRGVLRVQFMVQDKPSMYHVIQTVQFYSPVH